MKKITDYARAEKAASAGNIAGKTLIYFFILIWAHIVLFPFYWMVIRMSLIHL